MATHNPKESRKTCESTLNYMYRGEGHEHTIEGIKHIGGNLLSPSPITHDGSNPIIDLNLIAAELNQQASRHTGTGQKLFKHYVVSLAPNESLDACQWLEFISSYMQALGFDESTKWTAVEHKDTNASHVHILACRVKCDKSGSLVSSYKDYEKGWPVMRAFERKFGLQQLENPDENFGKNKSKAQIKASNKSDGGIPSVDEAEKIRRAFKRLYSEFGKPKTMKELALGLAKCGVELKVSASDSGAIKGINYRLKEGRGSWIPGSKIKATRFTWGALQKKEYISYDPHRDDPFLRRADGVVEIHIKSSKIFEYYSFKSSVLELEERQLLLARFRVQKSMDIESLMEMISAILILILRLLGIKISMDDCAFSVNESKDKSSDIGAGNNVYVNHGDKAGQFIKNDLEILRATECWVNPYLIEREAARPENWSAENTSHDSFDIGYN